MTLKKKKVMKNVPSSFLFFIHHHRVNFFKKENKFLVSNINKKNIFRRICESSIVVFMLTLYDKKKKFPFIVLTPQFQTTLAAIKPLRIIFF